jgi:hypothetical protein
MIRTGLLALSLSIVALASSTYTVAVIPPPSGYVNVTMSGINNSGQVTGTGYIGSIARVFMAVHREVRCSRCFPAGATLTPSR